MRDGVDLGTICLASAAVCGDSQSLCTLDSSVVGRLAVEVMESFDTGPHDPFKSMVQMNFDHWDKTSPPNSEPYHISKLSFPDPSLHQQVEFVS